jgi:hypothetical protein
LAFDGDVRELRERNGNARSTRPAASDLLLVALDGVDRGLHVLLALRYGMEAVRPNE